MEPAEEPKPFVVPPESVRRRARKPPNGTPEVPTEANPPGTECSPAKPDHTKVPPVPGRTVNPQEFFDYWASVPEMERKEWFIAYVYRGIPVSDATLTLTPEELKAIAQGKARKPETNIAKLVNPLDPKRWREQILEKFGAGDYGIRLNDQHPSIKKTVCFTAIDPTSGGPDFRNWDSYPPVLNPAEVVLSEESNESYLRWARMAGIRFPGDPGTEDGPIESEENDDMGNAAPIVQDALKHAERMTDKVLEMANQRPAAAAPAQPGAEAKGQLAAVELATDGARRGMEVMGQAMTQVMERASKAADPGEQIKLLKDLASVIAPKGDGGNGMVEMMRLQLEAQEKNAARALEQQEKSFTRMIDMQRDSHHATVKMLESRLESLEKERTAAPSAPGNEMAVLDKMLAYKAKLDEFAETNAPAPQGPAWLAPVLEFGTTALGNITQGLSALEKLRNAAPPAVPPAPAAIHAPQQQQAPQESEEVRTQKHYRTMIHPHLMEALKRGAPGWEFGAALIGSAGQVAYDSLTQAGYAGVLDFLQCIPEMYQELIVPPMSADRLDQFVNELVMRDKVMAAVAAINTPPVSKRGPQVV